MLVVAVGDAMAVWACVLQAVAWKVALVVAVVRSVAVGLLSVVMMWLDVEQEELVLLILAKTCAQVVCLRIGLLQASAGLVRRLR